MQTVLVAKRSNGLTEIGRWQTIILLWRRSFAVSSTKCASKTNHKGKSDSSTRWLRRQQKDPFVHQAAKDGYRCRSAYKLLEIDNKFNFLKPGASVVDCGASPGSWTQVALQRTRHGKSNLGGVVIAVDLLVIQPIPGAIILDQCDFTKQNVQEKIKECLPDKQTDVIISDMAPSATGNKKLDHSRIMDLNSAVLEFSSNILKTGGCFLCKLWDGNEKADFLQEVSDKFKLVKEVKPKASRMDSGELYIFSSGFK